MDFISDFAQGFMALFQAGGETFVGWVTGNYSHGNLSDDRLPWE